MRDWFEAEMAARKSRLCFRIADVTNIGGFQSPMDKECLNLPLRGGPPGEEREKIT